MRRILWYIAAIVLLLQMAACGSVTITVPSNGQSNNNQHATATPGGITITIFGHPTNPTVQPAKKPAQATTAGNTRNAQGNNGSTSNGTNTTQADKLAQQLLQKINQDRAANGKPAYAWEPKLQKSAALHDQVMAGGCGLNHVCSGEPQLGTRESNQGVQWNYAGENIGEGGPVQSDYNSQWSMVLQLHNSMMAEQPPDDGHRQNLLSSDFQRVGISIYVDAHGTLWLTEDFAN